MLPDESTGIKQANRETNEKDYSLNADHLFQNSVDED